MLRRVLFRFKDLSVEPAEPRVAHTSLCETSWLCIGGGFARRIGAAVISEKMSDQYAKTASAAKP
jgi:hypothetical protein